MRDIKLSTALFASLMMGFLFTPPVSSATYTYVDGTIQSIEYFLDSWNPYNTTSPGMAGIYMSGIPAACGSGMSRVVITSDHQNYAAVVAAVTAAKLSGVTVRLFYLEECTVRSNSWDFAYFQLL